MEEPLSKKSLTEAFWGLSYETQMQNRQDAIRKYGQSPFKWGLAGAHISMLRLGIGVIMGAALYKLSQ